MTEPSLSAKSGLLGDPFAQGQREYKLSSELARLSLPAEYIDNYRRLAWVNSICFLFLLIGLIGIRSPAVMVKPLSKPPEVAELTLPPPDTQPKPPVEVKEEEPAPDDAPIETPQVATIVAAADSPNVAFAVPVEGAVAITKEVRFAPPPPPKMQAAPPKPTQFDPNAMNGGFFPDPSYPGFALRNRYQGTVVLEFTVEASGKVTSVKVQKTSGFPVLDEAAMKAVQERWRFPPGGQRYYYKPFEFKLQ
jgi:TonB family protein